MAGSAGSAYCAAVVVLGDLGRSPRMLNHALALADRGAEVWLAGCRGAEIDPAVSEHPRVHVCAFRGPSVTSRLPRFVRFLARITVWVVAQHAQLFHFLFVKTPRPNAVLVQNPPSIPTLLVALAASRLRGAKLIVDWHNFGHSLLALRLGKSNPLVFLNKACERVFGGAADAHFCVSRAMREELSSRFGLRDPVVLYDRPRRWEDPTPRSQRRRLLEEVLSEAEPLPERCFTVVCPTSWTTDEDMGLLLEAVQAWDCRARARVAEGAQDPAELLVLVTGIGPLRRSFEERLARIELRHARVRTLWLEPRSYRELLRAADLGVCLHRSASGVDLPMKVVDFFAARTPVCALDYGRCLGELVRHRENGLLFSTSEELADQLFEMSESENAIDLGPDATGEVWDDAWRRHAAPVFEGLGAHQQAPRQELSRAEDR